MSMIQRFFTISLTRSPRRAWLSVGAMVVFSLLAALSLAGCGEPMAIAVVEPTATVFALPPTDIPSPSPGPTPEALDFPLAAPTSVEVEPVDDQACVNCHTSEETLKEVAEEEESPESLSEGEG
jgi:hypothetical protein